MSALLLDKGVYGARAMEATTYTLISEVDLNPAVKPLPEDMLSYNVRMTLIEEIDKWLGKMKNKNRRCADKQLRYLRDLLSQDMALWQYIKKTNDSRFIDESAYLCLIVIYQLTPEEKEFMDKWLTDEGFYDTVY